MEQYNEILHVTDKYDALLRDADLHDIGRLSANLSWYSSGSVKIETEPRRVVPDVVQGYSLAEGLVLDWLIYRIPVVIDGAFLCVNGVPQLRTKNGGLETTNWKTLFGSNLKEVAQLCSRKPLNAGMVVRLKSGSPSMTVMSAVDQSCTTPRYVWCQWFDRNKACRENFPEESLLVVDDEPISLDEAVEEFLR